VARFQTDFSIFLECCSRQQFLLDCLDCLDQGGQIGVFEADTRSWDTIVLDIWKHVLVVRMRPIITHLNQNAQQRNVRAPAYLQSVQSLPILHPMLPQSAEE
jgi:hypothetical protein